MPHTAICPRMPHEMTQKSWSKHIMRSIREKESRLFFSMIRNSSQQPQDDDGWWSTLAVKLWMEIVRQMRVLEEKKTETNDDGRRTMDVKDLHLEETRLMDYQHKLDCIQFIYILLIPQTILCVVSVCV